MKFKSILASVCFGTGALLWFSASAHAVTPTLSAGTSGSPNTQGTFSSVSGATTINFNSASSTYNATTLNNTYTSTNSGITTTYTWTSLTPTTGFLDGGAWSPPNPSGATITRKSNPSDNTSRYLVVNAQDVTITFSAPMRYFGLNWGNADTATTDSISFYNGTTLLNTFTGTNVFGTTAMNTTTPAEPSAYVDFNAASGETFNRIVLSNAGATTSGFENDNHAYRVVPFGFSPSTGIVALGILFGGKKLFNRVKNIGNKAILG